jgi:hypothetical protein
MRSWSSLFAFSFIFWVYFGFYIITVVVDAADQNTLPNRLEVQLVESLVNQLTNGKIRSLPAADGNNTAVVWRDCLGNDERLVNDGCNYCNLIKSCFELKITSDGPAIDIQYPDEILEKLTGHNTTFAFRAKVPVKATIKVEGKLRCYGHVKVFGYCQKIARETVGFTTTASGSADLTSRIVVTGLRIEQKDADTYVVFTPTIQATGEITQLDVNQLDLTKCNLFGIKLFSYCGLLEDFARDYIDPFLRDQKSMISGLIRKILNDQFQDYSGKETALKIPKLIK